MRSLQVACYLCTIKRNTASDGDIDMRLTVAPHKPHKISVLHGRATQSRSSRLAEQSDKQSFASGTSVAVVHFKELTGDAFTSHPHGAGLPQGVVLEVGKKHVKKTIVIIKLTPG